MNKPVLYIIILWQLLLNQITAQQNLVPNGGFEEYSGCPPSTGHIKCTHWFSPIETTPDFYTPCGLVGSSVPINAYGTQNAYDGSSYMGINLNADDGYREYIAVKLLQPLLPLKKYILKFYVSVSDTMKYGSNNLGAYFVKDTAGIPIQFGTGGTPNIISTSNIIFNPIVISDMENWVEVTLTYEATGCEEFLIIGNFRLQSQTSFGLNLGSGIDSYYYIDQVSLTELVTQLPDLPNIFTPNGDGINDVFEIGTTKPKHTEILNRWGNLIYESNDLVQWDGGDHTEGVYYYKIDFGCGTQGNIKTGFVQLIR